MISFVRGNIIKADTEALVNTVNCVGVMGKGIALQFKKAFPDNFKAYARSAKRGEIRPGEVFTFSTRQMFNPKYIINFPTKQHWKEHSRIEYVREGLKALVKEVQRRGIKSIAIPPLGCGSGGLDWGVVKPLIVEALRSQPAIAVSVFEPHGAPEADSMPISNKPPHLTRARALVFRLLDRYCMPGYRLRLLEIQKLAYFLQVSGEELRLNFVRGKYGPYAENLNHLLQALDGHFITGYGDRSRDSRIKLLPGIRQRVEETVQADVDGKERLERVGRLIEGFETPYGLELLATVHWVANERRSNEPELVRSVQEWSNRKRQLFSPDHIRKAVKQLSDQGFIQV